MQKGYESFIINQGVHEEDKIIEEKGVLLRIKGLKSIEGTANAMSVSFEVLSGPEKGRTLSDFIHYDPSHKMSWKYRRLRASAGVPYTKDESKSVDIGRLLANKAVRTNLSKYTSPDDGREFQNIDYLDASKGAEVVKASNHEEAVDLPDEVVPIPPKNPQSVPVTEVVQATPIGDEVNATTLEEEFDETTTENNPEW